MLARREDLPRAHYATATSVALWIVRVPVPDAIASNQATNLGQ